MDHPNAVFGIKARPPATQRRFSELRRGHPPRNRDRREIGFSTLTPRFSELMRGHPPNHPTTRNAAKLNVHARRACRCFLEA